MGKLSCRNLEKFFEDNTNCNYGIKSGILYHFNYERIVSTHAHSKPPQNGTSKFLTWNDASWNKDDWQQRMGSNICAV